MHKTLLSIPHLPTKSPPPPYITPLHVYLLSLLKPDVTKTTPLLSGEAALCGKQRALLGPRGVMISASSALTPTDGGNEALDQLRAALDARERRLEALQSILDQKSEEAAAVHASYSMMYDELQMCAPRITHRPSSARHAACRTRV